MVPLTKSNQLALSTTRSRIVGWIDDVILRNIYASLSRENEQWKRTIIIRKEILIIHRTSHFIFK